MTVDKFTGYAAFEPYVLDNKETHLKVHTFQRRPLEPDEVEILVSACGICGSDVHQITNGWKRATYPLIPGHELIGKITAVGDEVAHLKLGDRVGVSPVGRSCGDCGECADGFGQLCPKKVTTYNGVYKGHTTFGGYADRVCVQAKWAIKIPDNIADEDGAPLLCAGITTYLPFKHHKVDETKSVGIVGIGGLGHLAVQWARAHKCKKIIAFSSSRSKEQEAKELGATDYVAMNEGIADAYLKSVDLLLVCGSGTSSSWDTFMSLVKNRGTLVMLDLPEQPVAFSPANIVYRHTNVVGSFVGSHEDLAEMLAFASKTGVRPWIQKVGNSLDEVNRGINLLMNGKAHYRLVICGEGRDQNNEL